MNKVVIRRGKTEGTSFFKNRVAEWAMECHKSLFESHLLVIGLNGIGSELVKNLCVGGMRLITIMDDTRVSESDSSANFFCSAGELGKMRSEASLSAIKELNPNVRIEIEVGDPSLKPETFYKKFNLVFATGLPLNVYGTIDKICRENNVQFYCADTWGMYGYFFLDLKEYKYKSCIIGKLNERAEIIATNPETGESLIVKELSFFPFTVTLNTKVGEGLIQPVNKVYVLLHIVNHFREMYLRFPQPESHENDMKCLCEIRNTVYEVLGIDPKYLEITDKMLSCVFGELSPICSIVGGVLAHEMLKGIMRSGLPICNYFFFDGDESTGEVELIPKQLPFERLYI